ncbi:MAG: phage tail protein, partial [Pseudomonadota bacterium]
MATLLLTAVGTAVGGPLGGALGALVGQQADRALFGTPTVEGPRVKELSVTTSSYGQPIARHFGQMRVAGTVIWATDLVENSSTEGGKGRPKTTTYSYSANFAVAISSNPIVQLGRIWADGNLLRGAGEDLKVDGELRVYLGNGDAPVDPLIAADKGAVTPAFRECAYVVFENLQLADFGNRIPALTFEILSSYESQVGVVQLVPGAIENAPDDTLDHVLGFSDEGGPIGSTLSGLGRVLPLSCVTTPDGFRLSTSQTGSEDVRLLPEQRSSESSLDASERHRSRARTIGKEPLALRYYDIARDYQPGVQRTTGRRRGGQEVIVDLPAALSANGAKALANGNANRVRWQNERLIWRISELDPSIRPGSLVKVPMQCGVWRIESWE